VADQKLRVDITARDRSRQAFSRVQRSLGALKKSLFSVKGLIGAAFGALAVRALVKFVTNTVKASDAIVKTADAIGISTDKLQELRHAADLSGVSVDKLDKALLGFSKRVGEARANTGSLVTFLKATNVELLGSVQSAQTVDEAFALIIKAARSMGNEMDQSALLAAAFGSKAGVALKNLLPDMEALMAEARRLGIVIDEDLLRGAAEMNDEFSRLGAILSAQLTNAVLNHKDEIIALTRAFILAIPQIAAGVKTFAMWLGLLDRPLSVQLSNANLELREFEQALKALQEGNLLQDIATTIPLALDAIANLEFETDLSKSTEEWVAEKIAALQNFINFLEKEIVRRDRALANLDAREPIDRTIVIPPKATETIVDHDAAVKRITESIEAQTRALRLEQDTLGKSTAFKTKATMAEQVLLAARQANIDLKPAEITALEELINKHVLLSEALETEKQAMAEATRVAEENEQQIRSLADSIETSLIDSLADLSTGFENWRDVARSALRDVIRAMLQFVSVQSGMGGGGGILSNLLGSIFTSTPETASAPIATLQSGGPLGAGRAAIVGEGGPELFVPRSAGHVVPNHALGGGVTVNQTINLSTGVQATVRAEVMGLLPQIAASTKSAVLSARVRGGAFADAFGA